MRTNLSILAAAAAVLVLAAAASVATASPRTAPAKTVLLQQALDAVVAAGAPGAIVLVRDGDRTIRLASGYGNLARRTPMRTSDRFRVGSETKMFVSTVVLQLVGDRKLALVDTVEQWLPGLVPNGGSITVRQLLNHTSGLFDYAEDKTFIRQVDSPRKRWTPRQLVELATAQRPLFAPGTRHSYSNTGYILLGLIVEKATGNSLETELQKRIFAPLRLNATSFPATPRIAGRYAHGYTRYRKPRVTDISVFSPSILGAAGAIVSNAGDLARFHRALFRGRLLRPDLLKAMKTTVAVPQSRGRQAYGLGLIMTRYGPCGVFWGHGGGTIGYETFTDSSGDGKRDLVISVNTDGSVLGPRAQQALGRLTEIAHCS